MLSKRAMRVLHIIPSIENQSGGSVAALIHYVNSLKAFVNVEIVTTNFNLTEESFRTFLKSVQYIPVHCFDQIGTHSRNISWVMSEWLRKNITNYDLAHIYALFSPMSTIAAFWARQKQVPYIVKTMGTLSHYTFFSRNRLLKRLYFETVERRTLQGAAALQFTSSFEMEDAARCCHLNRAVVIPIPTPFYEMEKKEPTIFKNILFMSRIHPKKGLDLLIPAFAQIAFRYPNSNLIIAGDGERHYMSKIKRLVEAQGLEKKVRFLGFINGTEKGKVFRESTLFVLPSHDENFGVVVAEAMASGLPVIVSDQVGICPDIQKYSAGLVVKCEVDSIKEGLEKLLKDPDLCYEMGRRGQQLVQEKYNSDRIGESLFKLYSEIIQDFKTDKVLNQC